MIDHAGQLRGYGLALETSGPAGSLALGRDERVWETAVFPTSVSHAAQLLPTLDRLCRSSGIGPADIAWVAVSGGPGSFTGLRVGVAFARMLALAQASRVLRIPTMEAIAQNAMKAPTPPERVAVLVDAQRGHVYAAAYERRGGRYRALEAPVESDAWAYVRRAAPACVMGEGAGRLADLPAESPVRRLPPELNAPRCEIVYELGWERARTGDFDDPRRLIPIYVRPASAEEVWKSRQT